MRKFLLLSFLTTFLPILAHYSIHSSSNGVMVKSGAKSVAATKGMIVKPSDQIVIPNGGKVEIYNDMDKRIYTSLTAGTMTVTRLMIDARSAASDNRKNVASRLRFGKKSSGSEQRLYVEKGVVKRSLGVYDPEGEKIVADPSIVARFIAARIASGTDSLCDSIPVEAEHTRIEDGGVSFNIRNTMSFPIYFNIVKIKNKGNFSTASISEVGQPTGIYVLLPEQTIGRGHYMALPDDELHLMVMTHCQFEIDEMIEALDNILRNPDNTPDAPENLPVYLTIL